MKTKAMPKKAPDKKGAWIDVQKKVLKGCSQCGNKTKK